jgi:hypothetical protein
MGLAIEKIRSTRGMAVSIAAACEITPSAVYRWRRVPHEHVHTVAPLLSLPPEMIRPDIFREPPPEDPTVSKIYGRMNIKKAHVKNSRARLMMDRVQAIALATNVLKAAEAREEVALILTSVVRRRVIVSGWNTDLLASPSPEPHSVPKDSANVIRLDRFNTRVNRK